MAGKKKKFIPGSIAANKLIAEIPAQAEKIRASIMFRHDALETQKRVNYQNEFDRMHGMKHINPGLISRMKELQGKAHKSLKPDSHFIYKAKL
jgi:hypothetical protein